MISACQNWSTRVMRSNPVKPSTGRTLAGGIVTACGDGAYGSWDRVPPRCSVVAFRKKTPVYACTCRSWKVSSTQRRSWDRCHDFLNIFAKKIGEKMAFFTQNKAKLFKILIITLFFEKNAIFSTENGRKLQKIVIIASTPVCFEKMFFLFWNSK
jgi:hypothetical protein